MKNLLITIIIVLSFTVESMAMSKPFEVDYIEINKNGIEKVIVERIDASSVSQNMVTYRVFVDMKDNIGYQLTTGSKDVGKMYIKTTGAWYNTPKAGRIYGDSIVGILLDNSVYPNLEYDSFVTSGGLADDRYGVPYSEDNKGYIKKTPPNTFKYPGLNLNMFNNDISTENLITKDGSFAFNPNTAKGAVMGPNSSNIVMIGQFTTDGNFEFLLNIQTFDFSTKKYIVTPKISYLSSKN